MSDHPGDSQTPTGQFMAVILTIVKIGVGQDRIAANGVKRDGLGIQSDG